MLYAHDAIVVRVDKNNQTTSATTECLMRTVGHFPNIFTLYSAEG